MTGNIHNEGPRIVKCRQVPEGKARALRKKGHGKRPNATKTLTVQDEEQLWKNRVLGEQKPTSLRIPVQFFSSLPIQHNRTATLACQTESTTFMAVRRRGG